MFRSPFSQLAVGPLFRQPFFGANGDEPAPSVLNAFRQYLLSGIGSTYDDSGYLRDSGAGKGTYRGPRGAYCYAFNGTNNQLDWTEANTGTQYVSYFNATTAAWVGPLAITYDTDHYEFIPAAIRFYNLKRWSDGTATTEQVQATSFATNPANLLSWHPCQEESGSTSYDIAGEASHATIAGTLTGVHVTDTDVDFSFNDDYGYTLSGAVLIPTVPNTLLDAIGGTADFTGLTHYRGRSYPNTLTGNGTNVYGDAGSALIPPTADWDASTWYYHQADETKAIVGQYTDAANPGRWQINTRTSPANSLQFGFGGGAGIVLDSVLQVGSWHLIEFGNNANVDYLRVHRNGVLISSDTRANAVSFDQANTLLLDRSTAASIKSSGSIANFQITTGGVTKTLVPEGTGTRLWLMGSDGSAVELTAAIQGTIGGVHGTAALATEDWFMRYGGSVRTSFDGVDDYIDVPVADIRPSDLSGRIEAYFSCPPGTTGAIFAKSDTATADNYFSLAIFSGKLAVTYQPGNNRTDTVAAFDDGLLHHVILESNGSSWTITVDGVVQPTVQFIGSNTGQWLGDVVSSDNTTIGCLIRTSAVSFFSGIIHDVKIYDPTDTLVNHWRGYGVNDWSDQVGSNDGTVVGASTVYIPNKTDGTSVISGLTPTSTGGQLLEGRKTDKRGGVDSAFAQRVNLESEYTYGDARSSVSPTDTKRKAAATGVEFAFAADDEAIADGSPFTD